MQISITLDTEVPEDLELWTTYVTRYAESLTASETDGGADTPAPAPRVSETPTKASETAPEPEPPADEPEEELDKALLDEAVEKATALMDAGGSSKILAALKEIGAPKVTKIETSAQLRQFLALIED